MKPVSYQSLPSSVANGHPPLGLDRVLGTSNVMYCEKCGFASTDPTAFKKHVVEHMGTRFYCFYCNNVSFSEAELNAHLKQHTSQHKYPFKCPHCGHGYMRRLCLVKHIERLHSKNAGQAPAKPGVTRTPHGPVSSALPGVPGAAADPPPLRPLRPLVRVTVPPASVPVARLAQDEQKGKTLDLNLLNATNGNGLIQHNRALTVSLPEEVTIPAGCLVELVDVKTVNGTKELKLRFVSQQENESVIKDGRTAAPQITALGKPLSSALNHPNTVKTTSMGMCTVNRKTCETKTVSEERPTVTLNVPKSHSNQVSKEKPGLKRTSQEVVNLECHTVVPSKVPKSILNPVRDRNSGIIVAAPNPNVQHTTVICTRVPGRPHPDNIATHVSQRTADERKTFIPEHSKIIAPRKPSELKTRDVTVAVKLEPGEAQQLKDKTHLKQQGLKSASPSLIVSAAATAQVRPPAISVCKDTKPSNPNPPFPVHSSVRRTLTELLSVKTPLPPPQLCGRTNSKASPWTQEVRLNERTPALTEGDRTEPEGFPIISSVFSLSQQPEDVQGSMQPLVMALRGIVMDKTNGVANRDQVRPSDAEVQATGHCARAAAKNGPAPLDGSPAKGTGTPVKEEEHDKEIPHLPAPAKNDLDVKEEEQKPATKNASSSAPEVKSPKHEESVPKPKVLDPLQTHEPDASSRYLTVSLKRVQVGGWKKSKKGLKLRISKYKTRIPIGCTVIHPMPLKVDQPVKWPGPNQPVVVLNHPRPRAPVQGAGPDAAAAPSALEAEPKCQILKMRLSKVMGQKYEVMGCTVGVSPEF